jgi:hypothetical protein
MIIVVESTITTSGGVQGDGLGVVAARGASKANAAAPGDFLHEGMDSELVFELPGAGLVVLGPAKDVSDGKLIASWKEGQ